MASKIRLTSNEIKHIALFESVTGAMAKDCIIDDKLGRIIFIVNCGDLGLAIGKGGSHIRTLKRMIGRDVELVEYSDEPSNFIRNSLAPAKIKEVRMSELPDGRKIVKVTVEPKDKGVAIGKNGKTAERTRFLAKRYFCIDKVIIT